MLSGKGDSMGADGHLNFDTKIDESGFSSGVKKLGSIAKGGMAVLGTAVGMATTAVGVLVKSSVQGYAEYEQLVGGVETLFKSSSDTVKQYADDAYKTAGLSANEYMSTITGFSASLLQGLGGDTAKAAEIGNMAVTDMSDNANKMGTNMQDIQNAYQGFAKQNYTMLDNLKLGYGGTKEEMERLLVDAEKLTGIKYDISNFSDVISAIHAVQDNIGITGTTAEEAATTIEGSFNMAKAAWSNLVTGMADDNANFDQLVTNFVDSVSTAGKNILPRVEIAINGVSQLIDKLLPTIAAKIPEIISSVLPGLVNAGTNIVSSLVKGISSNSAELVSSAGQILNTLVEGIVTMLPMLGELALNLILEIANGITTNAPQMVPKGIEILLGFISGIVDNLPKLLEAGLNMIMALAEGLINSLPTLIEQVPKIINAFFDSLDSFLPKILEAGIKLIIALGKGIIQSIPTIIANAGEIVKAILNVVTHLNLFNAGKGIIKGLGNGLKSVGSFIKDTAKSIVEMLKHPFSAGGWSDIGKNIVTGIANGLKSAGGAIVDAAKNAAKSALDAAKKFLGIHSPSTVFRDQVGKYMAEGMGIGFENNMPVNSMEKSIDKAVGRVQNAVNSVSSESLTTASFPTSYNPAPADDTPIIVENNNTFIVDSSPLVNEVTKNVIKKTGKQQKNRKVYLGA